MNVLRHIRFDAVRWWREIDHVIFIIAGALLATGFIVALASSPSAAARMNVADPFYFFWRQGGFVLMGALLALGMSTLDNRGVRRAAAILFALALVFMVVVLLFGEPVKGAKRWIDFGPFSLQPVEMLKPGLVVLMAALFAKPPAKGRENAILISMLASLSLFGIDALLLLSQPDVGQTIVCFAVLLAMFLLAGVSLKWLGGLTGIALMCGGILYLLFPHVQNRVNSFFNPAPGEGYQLQKAQQAIAHGGLLGKGPGEGAVKMSLPDAHTDFAFSVAAEEFGLIALWIIIGLFGALCVRGLAQARRLKDPFAQLAASGLFCLVGLEAALNIAVNLAMVPPKGLALPFISYGGSSMLGVSLTIGLVLALTRKRPGAYERTHPVSSAKKAPA